METVRSWTLRKLSKALKEDNSMNLIYIAGDNLIELGLRHTQKEDGIWG